MDNDEDLQRSLALAKLGLAAPSAARARVRDRLGASALPSPAAGAAEATEPSVAAFLLGAARRHARGPALIGLSFAAGFWLGNDRSLRQEAGSRQETAQHQQTAERSDTPTRGENTAELGAALVERIAPVEPARAEPAVATSAAQPGSVQPAPRVPAPARHADRAPERSNAQQPRKDSFGAEVALLQRAERAIRQREPVLALALLAQLDREFPSSSLAQARAAARVLAECEEAQATAGGVARSPARAKAERFLASHSPSVYADRISELCELEDAPSRGH
jgi:hypothetical protein